MNIRTHPSSFRDFKGQVIYLDNQIFRVVYDSYQAEYEKLMKCGLYDDLIKEDLLIEHKENVLYRDNPVFDLFASRIYKLIKPREIPYISYPYEWSFTALKQAALATLKVQKRALEHGMYLRDANAYNIQFIGAKPVFIDTLSFGIYEDGQYWPAYRQFCQHFLNPLLLMSKVNPSLGQMSKNYIDGIPSDLVLDLLSWKDFFSISILAHVLLPVYATRRYSVKSEIMWKQQRTNLKTLYRILEELQEFVVSLSLPNKKSEWYGYYEQHNYDEQAFCEKKAIVDEWIVRSKPQMVWDIGGNEGVFSKKAGELGSYVVLFDKDYGALDVAYRQLYNQKNDKILPLVQDLSNPSPGIGWAGKERFSFFERGSTDILLALALIHHLVLTDNILFSKIAEVFSNCCKALIIEFIHLEDSQIVKMLKGKCEEQKQYYCLENFLNAFEQYFYIEECKSIKGSHRTLYYMVVKDIDK